MLRLSRLAAALLVLWALVDVAVARVEVNVWKTLAKTFAWLSWRATKRAARAKRHLWSQETAA